MSWLFAQWQKGAARHEPLVLILDEVQKLGTGAKDILPKLLREGRKFGISLMMATQLLNNYDGAKRSLFEQAATTLAFQQDGAAADLITKDKALAKNQKDRLCSLSRGTCLAIGRLFLGNMVSNQPILLNYNQKPPIQKPEQNVTTDQVPVFHYKIRKEATRPK